MEMTKHVLKFDAASMLLASASHCAPAPAPAPAPFLANKNSRDGNIVFNIRSNCCLYNVASNELHSCHGSNSPYIFVVVVVGK